MHFERQDAFQNEEKNIFSIKNNFKMCMPTLLNNF